MQTVTNAIRRSVSHNEIVTIEVGPSGLVCGSGETGDSVCAELSLESEDSAESREVSEYWGTDVDGNAWRVHVRRVEV